MLTSETSEFVLDLSGAFVKSAEFEMAEVDGPEAIIDFFEGDAESVGEWSNLLYDQALLAEGSMPRDPAGFARSVAKLMEKR